MPTSEPNWLLFQRPKTAVPAEFAELLWLDQRLIERRGAVKTWGESNTAEFESSAALLKAVRSKRAELTKEGFQLVREWTFDPQRFDFALLQQEVETAVRQSVTQLRQKHPGLNALAIMTDHDAMTISPVAHEFESLADAEDEQLWIPDEWSIWEGDDVFDIAYRLILSKHRDDLSQVDYVKYKKGFAKAVVSALEKLDKEGSFGPRAERLLLYYVSDDEHDLAAIRRLNTPKLAKRCADWQ